jgi:hypothetical protein
MSAEPDNGGGVPGWLAMPVVGVVGFAVVPPLVKAAVVAGALGLVLVFAVAHGHAMTVRAAAALYAGRAALAVAKALAIVAVEWPLRAAHRGWVHFDAPLQLQLATTRVTAQAIARAHRTPAPCADLAMEHRAEVLALPAAQQSAPAQPTELTVAPSRRHDGTTAA